MHRSDRTLARALTVVVVVLFASLFGLASADAHSALESTSPPAGSAVSTSPDAISLQFTEPVELGLGGVRVYDSERNLVSDGHDAETTGDGSLVELPVGSLPDEGYVVTWRVTSADSHPVSGAFTFTVGDGAFSGETDALVEELLAADGGSAGAGAAYTVDRALVFAGLAALVGMWAYVVVVHPGSFGFRRTSRLLWSAWGLLVVATALSIGLQGVTASGLPFGDITDTSLWSAVLDTRFGQMAATRLGLLVLATPLLVVCQPRRSSGSTGVEAGERRRRAPAWWPVAAALISVGLLFTVAWSGHAGSGRFVPLALGLDLVHLAAMSVWLGGLVGLVVVLLPRRDVNEIRAVVPRFSTLAFGCIVALVLTGSIQAWRQLGGLHALASTTYGRILLVKLALVVVVVGLAAISRSIVRRTYRVSAAAEGSDTPMGTSEVDDRHRLGRSVMVEVVLGVAVLVVTALLVNVAPGIEAANEVWSGRIPAGELTVDVTVDPASVGPVDLHVFVLDDVGVPVDVVDLDVELSLPDQDVEPLEVPVDVAGRGHYSALGYDVPFAGEWDLRVLVRVSDFEEVEGEGTVPIG
jgi:copper transport protein